MEKISLKKVKEEAEALFREGRLYCSEAVVKTIRDNLAPDMPESLIAAASGFPGGVGGSGCICGAVSGGVIVLGYLFGRTGPSTAADPKIQNAMKLAGELQESFRKAHKGVLCCHIHTKGLDMAKGENVPQCTAFTGEAACKTAEIVARELGLPIEGL